MNVLLAILIIIALGGLPNFGLTSSYHVSGGVGVVLLVLLILALTGRL